MNELIVQYFTTHKYSVNTCKLRLVYVLVNVMVLWEHQITSWKSSTVLEIQAWHLCGQIGSGRARSRVPIKGSASAAVEGSLDFSFKFSPWHSSAFISLSRYQFVCCGYHIKISRWTTTYEQSTYSYMIRLYFWVMSRVTENSK